MNKFIKCWLFILCILFILLILFTENVKAETLSNVRIYGIQYCSPEQFLTTGTSYSSPYIYSGSVSCNNVTTSTIRVYWSNIGTQMANKDIYFTTNVIGNIMGGINIRDNSGHVYPCENYTASRDGMVNVICKNVGEFNNTGASYEYVTYGGYNARASCSLPYVTNHDDYYNAMIYASVINTHSDLQAVINAINTLKTQDTTNTQNIINNQNQNAQQQHQDAQNINNSINSSDVTGNNSSSSISSIGNTFSSQEDFLLNLLTIPYTLWTSILNVFSNTCSPLDVGTIFNYHLVFPCIELNQFLGGIYATIIDVIFTAIIYSAFIRRVMKYFRELLTLDDHALVTGGVKLW